MTGSCRKLCTETRAATAEATLRSACARGPRIGLFADGALERDRAEVGHAEPLCGSLDATVIEDVMLLATVVADKPAHVLDQPERGHVEAAEHLQSLHRDLQHRVLRRADDSYAGQGNSQCQGQ